MMRINGELIALLTFGRSSACSVKHYWHLVFSSCHHLFTRRDNTSALEAEMEACDKGITLMMEWSTLLFILGTNNVFAASMIRHLEVNKSPIAT